MISSEESPTKGAKASAAANNAEKQAKEERASMVPLYGTFRGSEAIKQARTMFFISVPSVPELEMIAIKAHQDAEDAVLN